MFLSKNFDDEKSFAHKNVFEFLETVGHRQFPIENKPNKISYLLNKIISILPWGVWFPFKWNYNIDAYFIIC